MIIHRDVNTTNILLDSDFNGKLGDFGLSMMTMDRKAPIDTPVAGTSGYPDPEYICTEPLTQKSDVYGFGMVLLEIISGRKPIDERKPNEEINLLQWVRNYVGIKENPGKIVEIIDKKMDGNYGMKSITIVAKLALRCTEETSSSRPSMSEVVGELKEAFMYEKVKLKEAPVAKHRDSRNEVTIQVGR
jgi:serine/threonine protein kinase